MPWDLLAAFEAADVTGQPLLHHCDAIVLQPSEDAAAELGHSCNLTSCCPVSLT